MHSILSVNKHTLKAHAMPPANSSLVLTVQCKGPQQYAFAASEAGSGRCCLKGTFHADFLYTINPAASTLAGVRYFCAAPAQVLEAGAEGGQDLVGGAFDKEASLSVQASNVVSEGTLIARLERHVGEKAAVLKESPSTMVLP